MFGIPIVRARHFLTGQFFRGSTPIVLSVVLALLSTGEARASKCGAHVRLKNERLDPRPLCPGGKDCLPTTPVTPCRGPACSRGDGPIPVIPPSAPVQADERDATLAAAGDLLAPPVLLMRAQESSAHAIHHVFPPDPPPRFVARA
jgi:hypothetical protein